MIPDQAAPGQSKRGRTYLGFDYGTRKIGIAVGQNLTQTARGLAILRSKETRVDWEQITKHIDTWQPYGLVVGLPLDNEGKETEMSSKARKFGQKLFDRYNLPVHWVNEFLSSEAARQELSEQTNPRTGLYQGDRVAAKLILETFLNDPQKDKNGGVNGDA